MKQIWIIYSGMDMAGSQAEDNPSIFYGNQTNAETHAYEMSIQYIQSYEGMHGVPYFTEDEELIEAGEDEEGNECVPWDEIENYTDYYIELATPEKIEELGLEKEYESVKRT